MTNQMSHFKIFLHRFINLSISFSTTFININKNYYFELVNLTWMKKKLENCLMFKGRKNLFDYQSHSVRCKDKLFASSKTTLSKCIHFKRLYTVKCPRFKRHAVSQSNEIQKSTYIHKHHLIVIEKNKKLLISLTLELLRIIDRIIINKESRK